MEQVVLYLRLLAASVMIHLNVFVAAGWGSQDS